MSLKTLVQKCLRASAETLAAVEGRCPIRLPNGRVCGRFADVPSERHGLMVCGIHGVDERPAIAGRKDAGS